MAVLKRGDDANLQRLERKYANMKKGFKTLYDELNIQAMRVIGMCSYASIEGGALDAEVSLIDFDPNKRGIFAERVMRGAFAVTNPMPFLRVAEGPSGKYVETRVALGKAVLRLSESGGMAKEILKRLFEQDYRLPDHVVWDGRSLKIPDQYPVFAKVLPLTKMSQTFRGLDKFRFLSGETSSFNFSKTFMEDFDVEAKKSEEAEKLAQIRRGRKAVVSTKFNWANALSLSIKVESLAIDTSEDSEFIMSLPEPGTKVPLNPSKLQDPINSINLVLDIKGVIRWPMEFAQLVTMTPNEDKFLPALFMDYIRLNMLAISRSSNNSKKSTRNSVERITNISDIKELANSMPFQKPPRTNEDGFVLLSGTDTMGTIFYVPMVDRIDEYSKALKDAYDPETFTVTDKSFAQFKDTAIYTDWQNEKFTYINREGNITVVNLEGAVPLDEVTISRKLSKTNLAGINAIMNEIVDKYAPSDSGFYVNDLRRMVAAIGTPVDLMLNPPSSTTAENWARFREVFSKACQNALNDDLKQLSSPLSVKLQTVYFLCTLFAKYMKREHFDRVRQVESETRRNALYGGKGISEDKLVFANLPGLEKLLPHQLKIQKALQPIKEDDGKVNYVSKAILDAGVGAGKSPSAISIIASHLYRGTFKRPLILLPNNLVRGMVSEINRFSNGQLNAFAVTTKTIRRMQAVVNGSYDFNNATFDYEALDKIFNNLPINTILVVSYNFLQSAKMRVVYGHRLYDRYLNAEFLRDRVGIDAVIADEAHFIKNLASAQTQAYHTLRAGAKLSIPMSGTLIVNTVKDYLGLGAAINPSIYGNEKTFLKTYVENNEDATFMGPKIRDALLNYASIIKVDKWEYAAFLSPLKQDFHIVKMHPELKAFYDEYAKANLGAILASDAYKAALESGDEEKLAALENELEVYFAKLELFLSAPDTNEAYKLQFKTKPSLLVSPKVAKIAEICRKHFQQYFTPEVLKKRAAYVASMKEKGKKPQPMGNKIIVFANRVKTPAHVYENLPEDVKKHAVLYNSGDVRQIQRWINDDSIRVLIAAELTIKEGQNFQMANRLIRIETLHRPGDQEDQATGRVDRPDPDNLYKRDFIYLDWILIDESLEITKAARLISKIMQKATADYGPNENGEGGDASFKQLVMDRVPDNLPKLKLNLKDLLVYNRYDSADMAQYFRAYNVYLNWKQVKREEARKVTIEPFEIPDDQRVTIPNSKKLAYLPRVPGMTEVGRLGPEFPVTAIAVLEDSAVNELTGSDEVEEDDEDRRIDVVVVKEGDPVDTELGLGIVTKVLTNQIRVQIKGLPTEVTLPKTEVYSFTSEAGVKAAKDAIRKSVSNAIFPPGMNKADVAVVPPAPAPKKEMPTLKVNFDLGEDEDEEVEEVTPPKNERGPKKPLIKISLPKPKIEEIKKAIKDKVKLPGSVGSKNPKIKKLEERILDSAEESLRVVLLNGVPALVVNEVDSEYVNRYGFRKFSPLMRAEVKNAQQLTKLIKLLDTFNEDEDTRDALTHMQRMMLKKTHNIAGDFASSLELNRQLVTFNAKRTSAKDLKLLTLVDLKAGTGYVLASPNHVAANKLIAKAKQEVPTLKWVKDEGSTIYRVGARPRINDLLQTIGQVERKPFKEELKLVRSIKVKETK